MSEKKSFTYTYTSPDRRKQSRASVDHPYDSEAGRRPVIYAVMLGLVSCLLFAGGMVLSLRGGLYVIGGIMGILGIGGMASTPAFYRFLCDRIKSRKGNGDHA